MSWFRKKKKEDRDLPIKKTKDGADKSSGFSRSSFDAFNESQKPETKNYYGETTDYSGNVFEIRETVSGSSLDYD